MKEIFFITRSLSLNLNDVMICEQFLRKNVEEEAIQVSIS